VCRDGKKAAFSRFFVAPPGLTHHPPFTPSCIYISDIQFIAKLSSTSKRIKMHTKVTFVVPIVVPIH
jgi:hypothetical protein